jgi:hypothetical protein
LAARCISKGKASRPLASCHVSTDNYRHWCRLLIVFRIGPNLKPTYPHEEPKGCQTKTAELCYTTTSYDLSTSDRSTKTTATHTKSSCAPIIGCNVQDESTTTTTSSKCEATNRNLGRRNLKQPTCADAEDSIIYPKDPRNVGAIEAFLFRNGPSQRENWWTTAIKIEAGGLTAFFYVPGLSAEAIADLNKMKEDVRCLAKYSKLSLLTLSALFARFSNATPYINGTRTRLMLKVIRMSRPPPSSKQVRPQTEITDIRT